MQEQLTNRSKPLFVYARGRGQVTQSFEMIRLAHDLDEAAFEDGVWATTVINSNSPRQLDVPMARGSESFARARQLSSDHALLPGGGMAPVTVAGALVLQHAEALAGITLAQLARPGAPVAYGVFSSNVDMKWLASLRHARAYPREPRVRPVGEIIGLPWRSAAGAASNAADATGGGAYGNCQFPLGSDAAQATVTVHAAGWLR